MDVELKIDLTHREPHTNAGTRIVIASIETDSADSTVTPLDVPDLAQARSFRVVQTLTRVGDATARVTFRFRRDSGPVQSLVMEVNSHGL